MIKNYKNMNYIESIKAWGNTKSTKSTDITYTLCNGQVKEKILKINGLQSVCPFSPPFPIPSEGGINIMRVPCTTQCPHAKVEGDFYVITCSGEQKFQLSVMKSIRELDSPFTYAISGVTESEVEEIIKLINSIQELKEHHIDNNGELVIVFSDELMLYAIEIIKHHLEN